MPSEVPEGLARQFSGAARQAPEFIGMKRDEAVATAREHHKQVRVLSLDEASLNVYQDHRPDRLNLLILNGEVVRAAFF